MQNDAPDDMTIDGDVFTVVFNEEQVYAVWPAGQAVPSGWTTTGLVGDLNTCLSQVERAARAASQATVSS